MGATDGIKRIKPTQAAQTAAERKSRPVVAPLVRVDGMRPPTRPEVRAPRPAVARPVISSTVRTRPAAAQPQREPAAMRPPASPQPKKPATHGPTPVGFSRKAARSAIRRVRAVSLGGRGYRLPLAIGLLFLLGVFGAGMWYARTTRVTEAEVVVSENQEPLFYYVPLKDAPTGAVLPVALSNDVLFNTPIEVLESYLVPKDGAPDALEERKAKLKAYLKEKRSPFAEEVDTLASLKHWKLVLAISFAESNMGKKCRYNNCSGIGGYEPNFRKYKHVRDWMVDFDSLLERKYLGWSLEKMNGVYVQPKNPNWLLATRQVLSELQERNIE